MIRPLPLNRSQQQDFWNNREPLESFINNVGEVESCVRVAAVKSKKIPRPYRE